MLNITELDALVHLKRQYERDERAFQATNYDNKIKLLIEDDRRKEITRILNQSKYYYLKYYHLRSHNNRQIDIYASSLLDNRSELLINEIKSLYRFHQAPLPNLSFVSEYCRELEVAFIRLNNSEADALQQQQELHTTRCIDSKEKYRRAMWRILEDIKSSSQGMRYEQLTITDSLEGNTIGHMCFLERYALDFYMGVYKSLNSADQMQGLLIPNQKGETILALCNNYYFYLFLQDFDNTTTAIILNDDCNFDTTTARMFEEHFLLRYLSSVKIIYPSTLLQYQYFLKQNSNGDTLGHLICSRKPVSGTYLASLEQYIRMYQSLTVRQQYALLSIVNKKAQSMLDLCTAEIFLTLINALDSQMLTTLLRKNNIFHTMIHHMQEKSFITKFWCLLELKLGSSLVTLFDLLGQKQASDKAFITFLPANLLIKYIPIHQRVLNQTITWMHGRLSAAPGYHLDTTEERVNIMLSYLKVFTFTPGAMYTLACTKNLKKDICNYLLELPEEPNTIKLLQKIIDKQGSLGEFCWQKRWSIFPMFAVAKAEPATITKIRARLLVMQEQFAEPSAPPLAEARLINK